MSIETRSITSRDEWLKWRQEDVTASDAAALLGLHERVTPLMFYMDKAGIVPRDTTDNPSMRRGRLLEGVAQECIKELHPEWDVWPARDYVRDPVKRLGATPDIYVRGKTYSGAKDLGVVEVKNIEPYVFERTWRSEDGEITPPMAALLQVALTAHLTQAVAYIGALRVGHGVDFDLIEVPHTPGLIERLQTAAAAFWESVEKREAPAPDFLVDANLVMRMHAKAEPGKVIDLSGENQMFELRDRYVQAAAKAKAAEERKKAIKAELLHKMGDATIAMVQGEIFATAKVVNKKAEAQPRAAYSYRDVRFKEIAA